MFNSGLSVFIKLLLLVKSHLDVAYAVHKIASDVKVTGCKNGAQNAITTRRVLHCVTRAARDRNYFPSPPTPAKKALPITSGADANPHLMNKHILRIITSHDVGLLVPAFVVYVRPFFEYKTNLVTICTARDVNAVERVQRRFTKCLRGYSHYSYREKFNKNCIVYGYKVTQTFNY